MTKNIFLIQPGEKSSFYRMPLSLLAVGSALDKEGYNVKIVDMRFDDYKKYNYKNAIFVGVTVLTGPTIKHSLEFSRFIKENYPDVPVVWGGIHPSLLPNQTIKNKYIDIVVRGEGEITAVELARSLEKNKSLKGIRGLTYKRMGKIINNPERPFLNLDSLPKINYNLYPLDKATTALGDFPYNSSRGCPSRCKFCYNLNYNKRRWRQRSAKKVLEDIDSIVERANPKSIEFTEDNFFVDKQRAKKILQGLRKKNRELRWVTSCRFDYFAKYDSEFIELIKESGGDYLMFGAEAGSQRMLNYIEKDITIQEILRTVKKTKDAQIVPTISFICGFPNEKREDVLETLNLIDKIMEINPLAEINGMFGFTLYPGSSLSEDSEKLGAKVPASLEEWMNYNFSGFETQVWLTSKDKMWLKTVTSIIRFNYFDRSGKIYSNLPNLRDKALYFFGSLFYRASSRVRWKLRFFDWGYEWMLWAYLREKYLGHF